MTLRPEFHNGLAVTIEERSAGHQYTLEYWPYLDQMLVRHCKADMPPKRLPKNWVIV